MQKPSDNDFYSLLIPLSVIRNPEIRFLGETGFLCAISCLDKFEGMIRGEIKFLDNSVLMVREFVDVELTIDRDMYSYQYMTASKLLGESQAFEIIQENGKIIITSIKKYLPFGI
ncbi:hypothetical protein [Okeania sp. SIO1I7]|uniref:hypothetical protein n=1 Tax=Okeania sp. SIO1I7 TaxID=2607772 RepID=UPI0025DE172A|nr:hypothetical protein [Okeania sp. SIO1I7]